MNSDVYRLLAQLFEYPDPALPEMLDRMLTLLPKEMSQAAAALARFRSTIENVGIPGLREMYIEAFDFRADCALYIGHHLFGETGRHGAFMAELVGRYRELGLPVKEELPDHLSCMLRYLAEIRFSEEAAELIQACLIPALSRITAVKAISESPYLPVLQVLPVLLQESEPNVPPIGEFAWLTSSSSPFPMLP